jgi:uncharacterized membrane protein
VPIVKSIYSSVKQVSDTLFSSKGNAFREAVLVEYPRQGAWTIAFVTGTPAAEVAPLLGDPAGAHEHVSIYVPTTPNPTSGFFLMVPRAQLRPLTMSVDAALKHIISMGVVAPGSNAVVSNASVSNAAVATAAASADGRNRGRLSLPAPGSTTFSKHRPHP